MASIIFLLFALYFHSIKYNAYYLFVFEGRRGAEIRLIDSLIDSIIDIGRFLDARGPYPNGCPAVNNKFRRQITPKYPRLTIDD